MAYHLKSSTFRRNHCAVVLGGHTTALYVVRSLGRSGFKVIVIDHTLLGEARYSRYCNAFVRIERFTSDLLEELIRRVARTNGPCVVFPTTDPSVQCLSSLINVLGHEHLLMIPPWEITEIAYDKKRTYELAERCGIPVPETHYPVSLADVRHIARSCRYPVLVKPRTTERFKKVFGKKAIAVTTEHELVSLYESASKKLSFDDLSIQEFIAGSNSNFWHYGVVFDGERAVFDYVISRKRQYPIDFGTASHAEVADVREVAEFGSRMLREMAFRGMAEVQFKYDANRDAYMLLDVNPRFWKSCAIADLLGVNMPLLAYQLRMDEMPEVQITPSREPLIWIDLLPDLFVSAHHISRGQLSPKEWLESYRGRLIEASFSRNDPLPGIALTILAPLLFFRGTG